MAVIELSHPVCGHGVCWQVVARPRWGQPSSASVVVHDDPALYEQLVDTGDAIGAVAAAVGEGCCPCGGRLTPRSDASAFTLAAECPRHWVYQHETHWKINAKDGR